MSDRVQFISQVAVAAQTGGVLLLGLVLAYLAKLFLRRDASLWAAAWLALSLGLASVHAAVAFSVPKLYAAYLFFEWTFGFLLAFGCRELAERRRLPLRPWLPAVPVAAALAVLVALWTPGFNPMFALQAPAMAFFFGVAFSALGKASDERLAGRRLMRLALGALTVLFVSYGVLYRLEFDPLIGVLIQYSSFVDLFAELLLGIGMVLLLSEEARRSTEEALSELMRTRSELERQAQRDPLTEVFNRHAFHSLVERRGELAAAGAAHGVVLMIDVDRLKRVNDERGHAAGDRALNAAARAIRGLIRPEDLLFRWGGDEFLVLLPEAPMERVVERFSQLDAGVEVETGRGGATFRVSVSWGAADFGAGTTIAEAVVEADRRMYRQRAARDAPGRRPAT